MDIVVLALIGVIVLTAVPIALLIALMSPQRGTRLAPENNRALGIFAAILAVLIVLLAVVSMLQI